MGDIRERKAKTDFELELEDGSCVVLHTKFEVCPACEGKGKTVNPAIDSHGISPEEFAEDPDFEEAYFNGFYDEQCYHCSGKRVVPTVDYDHPENKPYLKAWEEHLDFEFRYQQEIEAERRMGA